MDHQLAGAQWIARPVPRAQRITRHITRSRIDWVEPGHTLAQRFTVDGPVTAVNIDLVGPEQDRYTEDVKYVVTLQTAAGETVAERHVEGSQAVWDYFGQLLDVTPPAPAGDYVVALRSDRGTIGWSSSDAADKYPEDGISPLPILGAALRDDQPVSGVRMIGVDTIPAPNPLFRRTFSLDSVPESALLAATVLGIGEVRINGARVGDETLEPAVTDYTRTVLYRTWEVGHLLRDGDNEILIEAGRERYAARGGDVWGWSLAPWHREPVAVARLEITDQAGAVTVVVTDESWTTAAGPVEAERLFRGEDWVLRAAAPLWEPVTVVDPPAGTLRPAVMPPARALPSIPPRLTERLSDNETVFDFGEVMVGRIRCRITGAPGAEVRVRSGEQRAEDGTVICANHLIAGEAQLDTIRLEEAVSDFAWEPQFGYRGFRWMQVETRGDVVVEQVRAVPIYADIDTVGELRTDEPIIEWIDAATARTFRNNLHGIPTDTPIYEKNGWTADAHLATEGLLHHFDLRTSFGKWMDDHIDAQTADGSIPWIIPTPGWGLTSDPAWSSSAVLIPWYLYREYGDRGILERTAPMIRRFADQIARSLDGGLWEERSWGDWLPPGYRLAPEGMAPLGTIMAVTIFQHTAAVLREFGDRDAAEHYEQVAQRTGASYHEAYFDADAGVYAVPGVDYRQVLNILPLAFGTVPEGHIASVRAGLIRDIEERTQGHHDCGAVGIRHLLPVLSDAGRDDLAITVLTRRSRPGWGAWFDAGESTLLESWDTDARSRNHYFLGSVSAWIQQRVGAIRLVEPGWTRFEIAPVDDPRVTRARVSHVTPLGDVRVSWERGPGGWRFEVTVPQGSSAQIKVPGHQKELAPGAYLIRIPV